MYRNAGQSGVGAKKGAELSFRGKAACLLLIDNQGGSEPGYPGARPWQKRLRELGVPEEKIALIPFTEPLLHTLSEAYAFVRFASERGWNRIITIAPPFHLLRCFLSAVTATSFIWPELRVYCQVGVTLPWHESAVHSQNVVQGLRKDLIVGELHRILKYQKEGAPVPLISTDDAFRYLEWRDATPSIDMMLL